MTSPLEEEIDKVIPETTWKKYSKFQRQEVSTLEVLGEKRIYKPENANVL